MAIELVKKQGSINLITPTPTGETIDKNLFANALNGSVSGTAVAINDASPFQNTVSANINPPTTVKAYGKNLFTKDLFGGSVGYIGDVDGCARVYENGTQSFIKIPGDFSMVYTLSIDCFRNSDFGKGSNVKARSEKFEARHLVSPTLVNNGEPSVMTVYGSEEIYFVGWGKSDICINLDTAQLELNPQGMETVAQNPDKYPAELGRENIAPSATSFEEYKEPVEYTPDANGNVEIPLIKPSTTLIADGAIITTEYNKDANKVIENLTNAIISLGGNV